MRIEFEQTIEHYEEFQKNYFLKNKRLRWIAIFVIAISTISILITLFLDGLDFPKLLRTILPLIVIAFVWFIIFRVLTISNSYGSDKNVLTGKRVVEFLEDEIIYETKISKTILKWDAIIKLQESKLCHFLYIGSNQSIIIPKSTFKNEQQHDDFKTLIGQKTNLLN